MNQVLHGVQYLSLLFLLHIEEEETAAPGAKEFAAKGSCLATFFVKGINALGTYGFRGFSL